MDYKKIANFFCDFIYNFSNDDDIMRLIKVMILTKFNFDEINWCFPLCSKEFYYKELYNIIAQYQNMGYSDRDIIEILNISEKDFEEAISYAEDKTNE